MANDIAAARQLIDKNSDSGGLNVNALCHELSQKVMQWTYTVYEIFNVLTERGFDQAAHEQVAIGLIERINSSNLIQLAQSRHGQILFERILYIMNCQANNCSLICHYIAEANARAKEIERSKNPRQLDPQEIEFYTERGQNQPFGVIKGGRVKGSARRLFNPEVIWELPSSGAGFVVYNRNDINGKTQKGKSIGDKLGLDQIGTKETIERIMNIAREWNARHPDRPLEIGDISRPGGINTTEHQTHSGDEFDIRPQSKSKTVGGLRWTQPDYSYPLTKEFVLLVVNLYPKTKILFNDPKILNDPETKNFVKSEIDHDDHLHVILP